jgi:hypothetical protein
MKDPYLLAKALAYAIVAIETRPETIRERADYDDMVLLFGKLPASEREMFPDEARRDLVNHRESASLENLPVRDELPSNDALRLTREIVRKQQ